MNVPSDLRYSSDHEWVRDVEEGCVRVGITDHAQDALGEVVFVQVPELGARVQMGIVFGEVESTKSVSELFAPVSGEVTAVNEDLDASPGKVNEDPYGEGWICEIAIESEGNLMDAETYLALIGGAV
ncbi:MAG: glycine cleavage system protein GcvH [Acidimicrobiales bacterium]|nr:glycine cleavage system protein GcvH [Acidimicrobiales bacterium]